MKLWEHIESYLSFILLSCFWLLFQGLFLVLVNVKLELVLILSCIWILLISSFVFINAVNKQRKFKEIENTVLHLKEKYLIHEVLGKSKDAQGQFYAYLLRLGNKSMLEHVSEIQRERMSYQEYIEQWVHEVKTPIAGLKLQCENTVDPKRKEMLKQLEKIEHYVEQVLFYARSENVEKDFIIQRTNLVACCEEALLRCKYLCTTNKIQIHLQMEDTFVNTDGKWIIFILEQVIENAVKYRKENAHLSLYITKEKDVVILHLQDNGCGISQQDIARVFEKGFTGENGRKQNAHATGIGLYLCQKLCGSLGIQMEVRSKEDVFSDFMLRFHI